VDRRPGSDAGDPLDVDARIRLRVEFAVDRRRAPRDVRAVVEVVVPHRSAVDCFVLPLGRDAVAVPERSADANVVREARVGRIRARIDDHDVGTLAGVSLVVGQVGADLLDPPRILPVARLHCVGERRPVGLAELLRFDVRDRRTVAQAVALGRAVPAGDNLPDVAEIDRPGEANGRRLRLRRRLGGTAVAGVDPDDVPPDPGRRGRSAADRAGDTARDRSRTCQPLQDVPARECRRFRPVASRRIRVAVPSAHWWEWASGGYLLFSAVTSFDNPGAAAARGC